MRDIKILIVEDEAIVALDIKRTILKMGFSVTNMVINYEDALFSVKENQPHIVLLDIHLKNSKDGIETAKAIKKIVDVPILYLTAFSDDKTIKRAVQTNPIGYLVKPFKQEDLKSALQLGIYKMQSEVSLESELTPLGEGYFYDLVHHNLFFQQHPIKLSQKEKLLLEILLKSKGNIVPFSTIEEYIWADTLISDSALRTLVYRLRSKLEYLTLETIPSFGLRL